MKRNILVFPCATQLGVEQYHSLKYNKNFNLIGAAHNKSDNLYKNYTQLKHSLEDPNLIHELQQIVSSKKIDIILPSHDEVLYILSNSPLVNILTGSPKDTIEICRFKSKTYKKLTTNPDLKNRVPYYKIINSGFLKPDKGQGSRGVIKVETPYLNCEFLPGKEYTVDCFTDLNGSLIYINPRLRQTILNGISEVTNNVNNPEFTDIAEKINKTIKFCGSWFFQMKEDSNGYLKFMEIAPRIGGGSNINRLNGVNLTLSDLYLKTGHNVKLIPQNLTQQVIRQSPKYNLDFDTIFVDYDDTFSYIKDVLYKLNKKIIIITRSKVKVNTSYDIIYVKDNENKSDIINSLNKPNAVFIDDSFKERKDVYLNCNIPCLTPEETNYLQ